MAVYDRKPEDLMGYVNELEKNGNLRKNLESRYGAEKVRRSLLEFIILSYSRRPNKRTLQRSNR